MKRIQSKLLIISMLVLVLGACNPEDGSPFIDPIVGEWTDHDEQFLTIKVNGEEMSMLEFGREVLKLTEEEAKAGGEAYFQHYYLGPIDINEPKLLFSESGKLNAALAGQPIEGTWELGNDSRVLYLRSAHLQGGNNYTYNLKKSTVNELILDWNWEMTVFYNQSLTIYDVMMEIRMVK